ncbi:hypothetical protein MCOR25_005184 [Pyricularia grisea]|nr:hypothetical protein MCOR25_005184 [Pyricularia grisea]
MGNCFGKPDSSGSGGDSNAGGARPSNTPGSASAPQKKKPQITGKGRTLGEAAASGSSPVPPTAAADAARQAALDRHSENNKKTGGKIGTSLQAQKKMTDRQVLSQAAEESRRQRELDDQARALRND